MSAPTPKPGREPPSHSSTLPFFASLAGYAPRNFGQDLVAGLTLSAIAIPEQMATARLAGFPPQIGFIAFVAGAVGFAAFGANRYLSVGADSTIAPIFAGGLALWVVGTPQYAAMAAALALAVGVILIVCGLFRLGWIADILSVPVTTGFLAGISIHIGVSQLPGLLGISPPGGALPAEIAGIATRLAQANPYAMGVGVAVLGLTIASERLSRRLPGALIGLAAATIAVLLFGLDRHGVKVLGEVSGALPHFSVPAVTIGSLLRLVPLALIISLLIMLQTGATTRSFASEPGEAPRIDRDFIGVGAASVLGGFLGAFPVNASPPRTAISFETGARSQLAGLLAACVVLGLAAFGTGLLDDVPEAALAGVLLFIAVRIFRVEVMTEVYRRSPAEFALILATMLAIVVLPIETGVAIGIGLSLIHGMWATTRAHPIELHQVPGTTIWWTDSAAAPGDRTSGALVIAFQAPLSFLNAYGFKQGLIAMLGRAAPPLNLVVLEASSIIAMDFTASQILAETIGQCQAQGVVFAIARLESVRAQEAFTAFGIIDLVGEDHVFHSVDEAIRALAPPP